MTFSIVFGYVTLPYLQTSKHRVQYRASDPNVPLQNLHRERKEVYDLDLIAVICHLNMILSCQTLQIILNGAYLYIIVMGVASILILNNPSPFRTKYQDN